MVLPEPSAADLRIPFPVRFEEIGERIGSRFRVRDDGADAGVDGRELEASGEKEDQGSDGEHQSDDDCAELEGLQRHVEKARRIESALSPSLWKRRGEREEDGGRKEQSRSVAESCPWTWTRIQSTQVSRFETSDSEI